MAFTLVPGQGPGSGVLCVQEEEWENSSGTACCRAVAEPFPASDTLWQTFCSVVSIFSHSYHHT